MLHEPPGENNRSTISNLFDPEQERALCYLRKQARTLRTSAFRGMKLELEAEAAGLQAPRWVFILDDGRALAWFGEERPYIVHPSFSDLCEMHRLRGAWVHAA